MKTLAFVLLACLPLACLPLACLPSVAIADEASEPVDYLGIMEKSKLNYVFTDQPLKAPAAEPRCDPRSFSTRVLAGANGDITLVSWTPNELAAPHFAAAEKHFAAREMDAALAEYDAGLELDPDYGPGWLYSGDIPFNKADHAGALARYQKAIALDPTLAQARRFAAHALVKLGRDEEAEAELIQALVFEPGYDGALEALEDLGERRGFTVRRPDWSVEAGVGERQGNEVQVHVDDKGSLGAMIYSACKAVWRHESGFRKSQMGPDASADGTWTMNEERACLGQYFTGAFGETSERLAKELPRDAGAKPAEPPENAVLAALPEEARHLRAVSDAGLMSGFIIHVVLGQRCPKSAVLMPPAQRAEAEKYIRQFVIVRDAEAAAP